MNWIILIGGVGTALLGIVLLGEAATVVLSKEGLNGREENVLVKNMEARVAALK